MIVLMISCQYGVEACDRLGQDRFACWFYVTLIKKRKRCLSRRSQIQFQNVEQIVSSVRHASHILTVTITHHHQDRVATAEYCVVQVLYHTVVRHDNNNMGGTIQ